MFYLILTAKREIWEQQGEQVFFLVNDMHHFCVCVLL